jgi:hypothetical protein
MNLDSRRVISAVLVFVITVTSFACGNEFTRSASPVALIVTNTQTLQRIDIAEGAVNCDQNIGEIKVQALLKSPSNVDQRFNDVRVTRYRVSYVRTDGGTLVPAPFVRTIDLLVSAGGAASTVGSFLVLQADAINQAPFAALRTANGGRDPETGRATVRMDVIVEIFGETLAGSNVSGRTRFPLDFCFNCNGCA